MKGPLPCRVGTPTAIVRDTLIVVGLVVWFGPATDWAPLWGGVYIVAYLAAVALATIRLENRRTRRDWIMYTHGLLTRTEQEL